MFLEIWMLSALLGMWLFSIAHMYHRGRIGGLNDGTVYGREIGAGNVITFLGQKGVIDVEKYKALVEELNNEP